MAGGNGSGKTTLAKLIMGLYVSDSGDLCYNHKPINDSNGDSYRQLFSAVFSEPFFFEPLLGLERTQLDKQAREYLRWLQLVDKVKVNDGVLSTIELSQGQRKGSGAVDLLPRRSPNLLPR